MDNWLVQGHAWFSAHWFWPETISGYFFTRGFILWGLAAIPFIWLLRLLLFYRFRKNIDIAFQNRRTPSSSTAILRFLPSLLLSVALALSIFSLARPQRSNIRTEKFTEGIDLEIVLDISESMRITDLTPNRLEAAKKVASNFVKARFQDRIGMVVFAGQAFALVPPTTDYNLLNNLIKEVDFNMIQDPGTAIGSALGVAINHLRAATIKSRVIILLSDGSSNSGNIDPITSANLAKAFGIKIYTIGVGTDGDVVIGKDMFGQDVMGKNTMDESTLKDVAALADGKYYRATNNKALQDIFGQINKLEKAPIIQKKYQQVTDYYAVYLMWAILFFLMWLLSKATFLSNPLED